jgi:chromate reductase, NAD(P)H dehydrogenase (quinone)
VQTLNGSPARSYADETERRRVLVFGASLRVGSLNRRLAAVCADALAHLGAEVELGDFAYFASPLLIDCEAQPVPASAYRLARALERSDGVVIASPEHNGSVTGILKTAIDWVSVLRPQPWRGRSALLVAASCAGSGGGAGLESLRAVLAHLGVDVFDETFTLPRAGAALDERSAAVQAGLSPLLGRWLEALGLGVAPVGRTSGAGASS